MSSPGLLAPFTRPRRQRQLRLLATFLFDYLTPLGRGVFALLLAGALMGQDLRLPIHRLFVFAAAALAVAAVAAQRALPRLEARRLGVPDGASGEPLCYDVEIVNVSRRTARDVYVLELDLPDEVRPDYAHDPFVVPAIAPGERVVVPVRLTCGRRGARRLRGLAVASSFPLGLVRALRRQAQESSFLVYPSFTTPESFRVPEGRNYQPGGILLSSQVGESSELMHVREWREGDSPRHVHWASTARAGQLIVKVFHEEYFVRLALVVDTQARTPAEEAALETGLSVAAGIADHLTRRDYLIDLFAAGSQVHHFQAGRSLAHLEHLLQLLACLEPASAVDWEALQEALIPEAPRLTGLVAIFTDWTAERERLVARLRALGVAVRVVVVREGETSAPLPASRDEDLIVLAPGAEPPASVAARTAA